MKYVIKSVLAAIIIITAAPLLSRDINLDEIYIDNKSSYQRRLLLHKLEPYQKINAAFVDRDVSFAWWVSGDEIIYISENSSIDTNTVYKYNVHKRKQYELFRFKGVITTGKVNQNGRYLILKRLIQNDNIIPEGQRLILDTTLRKMDVEKTQYAFLDFSIPSSGNSIVYETRDRIIELQLDSAARKKLLEKSKYNDIVVSSSPSIAHLSPDRNRILITNGSGGYYQAKLTGDVAFNIDGISSATEIFWIDNNRIIFRAGTSGNFSVVVLNIATKKRNTLLSRSFNTNITYSLHSKRASFLKDQLIHIYDFSKESIINTGLEGEDISFSPDGNKFCAIMYKKLFIVNIVTLKKKIIELKRSWKKILSIYKILNNKPEEYINQYSGHYIDRKIKAYNELAGH